MAPYSACVHSEYLRERARDEYLRGDYNINSDPQYEETGPLYTLPQRYADPAPNYSPHGSEREWEQQRPAPTQAPPAPSEPSPTETQQPTPEQPQPSVQAKKSKK